MNIKNSKIKKAFVIMISVVLFSAIFSSIVSSEKTVYTKPKSIFKYNLLEKIITKFIELFPKLASIPFFTKLIDKNNKLDKEINEKPYEFLDEFTKQDEVDMEINKTVKYNCQGPYQDVIYVDVGDWVTFKIIIENTGCLPLDITIRDEFPENLTYDNDARINGVPTPPEIINGNYYWYYNNLQSGGPLTLTFKATVTECGEFINNANVTGKYCSEKSRPHYISQNYLSYSNLIKTQKNSGDHDNNPRVTVDDGCQYVYHDDIATVIAPCEGEPDIDIEKTVYPEIVHSGETVTYNYYIENIGDTQLSEITLLDDKIGWVSLPQTDLETGESMTATVEDVQIFETITNIATVKGYSPECEMVSDTDSATVDVIDCAPEVWVDDSWFSQSSVNNYNPDLIWQYNAFNKIQDGVNAVCECGIVHVLEGEYYEQILIHTDLDLLGEPGAIIIAPTDLDSYTIEGSTEPLTPIIFAYGGTLSGYDVTGTETIAVTIDGFEINGTDEPNIIAIFFHNVEPGCTDAKIINNYFYHIDISIKIDGCTCSTIIEHNKIRYPKYGSNKIAIQISSTYDECIPDNVKINYNYIYGAECAQNIGIDNQVDNIVDARFNWWREDNGPSSPEGETNYDAVTNRIADGYGERVIGLVNFDPWWGVEASGTVTHQSGNTYRFDSRDSFAFDKTGDITEHIQYTWDLGDGKYSYEKYFFYTYDEPGTYQIELIVKVTDFELDEVNDWLIDYAEFTVTI